MQTSRKIIRPSFNNCEDQIINDGKSATVIAEILETRLIIKNLFGTKISHRRGQCSENTAKRLGNQHTLPENHIENGNQTNHSPTDMIGTGRQNMFAYHWERHSQPNFLQTSSEIIVCISIGTQNFSQIKYMDHNAQPYSELINRPKKY